MISVCAGAASANKKQNSAKHRLNAETTLRKAEAKPLPTGADGEKLQSLGMYRRCPLTTIFLGQT
ncbi:hypothetical protein EFD56_22570 [Rhizobium phaseoli]|nr:hypothetical protein EFD56_22570 [Rhizobium phaseoli]